MLYLSLLELNPRSRQVHSELRSAYEMHRTLAKAFGDSADAQAAARCLFRVDEDRQGALRLLVQSQTPPQWAALSAAPDYLCGPPQVKPFAPVLQHGQTLAFRLRANPTKRSCAKPEGKRQGSRVGLYREDERRLWLARQGTRHGFALEALTVTDDGPASMPVKGCAAVFSAARFEGVLRVTDAAAFASAIAGGVGSGKGFGFGLLSLSRLK